MQRLMRFGVLVMVLATMVGCEDAKKKEAEKAPPPKIRTKGEVAGDFQPAYRPLQDAVAAGQDVPRETGAAIAGALGSAKGKNAAEPNGPDAISQVTSELEDLVKAANDKQLWGTVVSACDALAAMDPSSPKVARYKDKAILQLNRPVVKITASTKIGDGKTVFFFDVFLPDKNKTESQKVSVGDEFCGLRFVEVIGNDEGVKLEYKAVGDTFDVKRPK
ncbi:MAG: hypothetical protein HZB26_13400 [Candidatus Hydrogenedentes bacterium]|nr:hypothetical protein [Candidatus Hydrogenedentota bacterium]